MNTWWAVSYETPGGPRLATVNAPGAGAARQHVLATRRDVLKIIDVQPHAINAATAAPTAASRGSKEAIMARTAQQKADAAAKQRARRAAKKAEATTSTAAPGVKPDSIPKGFKWCPRMKQVLPLSDFARNKASKDGYYSISKQAEALDRKAAAERRKAAGATASVPASGKPRGRAASGDDFSPVPEGSSATVVSKGRAR